MRIEGTLSNDAIRLLWAIHTNKTRGNTSNSVLVENKEAEDAGLDYERKNAAMWELIEDESLLRDEETEALMVGVVGRPDYGWYFFVTPRGYDRLQQAGF